MEKEPESKKIISMELGDSDTNDSNSENSTSQPDTEGRSTSNEKTVRKVSKALKELLMDNNSTKFMSNFDPELSNRERRKLSRKFSVEGKKSGAANDENGSEKDMCDCLIQECPGCHFPCPKCRSPKCGSDCRINRKWSYEAVEIEDDTSTKGNTCCILHS